MPYGVRAAICNRRNQNQPMQYFQFLTEEEKASLFFRNPKPFSRASSREELRRALGPLLYMPSTGTRIAETILSGKIKGLVSAAICLEDSVGDVDRAFCIRNVMEQVDRIAAALKDETIPQNDLPLLFIRIRDYAMLEEMQDFLIRRSDVVTGVILPKVTVANLREYLPRIEEINWRSEHTVYALPILESEEIITSTHRMRLLNTLRERIDPYYPYILNIRIGATDFSGLFGIRRQPETPVYSIAAVSGCIGDIVRTFGLRDRYTISAPVWEYFGDPGQTPLPKEIQGLLQECSLDLQNGLMGKAAIHPTQLVPVQALHAVPYEAFQDASGILAENSANKGVLSSEAGNKMNELKPHERWAVKTLARAHIYGVYRKDKTYADLLQLAYHGEMNV